VSVYHVGAILLEGFDGYREELGVVVECNCISGGCIRLWRS
jgi:hypothetical protein